MVCKDAGFCGHENVTTQRLPADFNGLGESLLLLDYKRFDFTKGFEILLDELICFQTKRLLFELG